MAIPMAPSASGCALKTSDKFDLTVSNISAPLLDLSVAQAGIELAQGRYDAATLRAKQVLSRIEASGLRPYFKRYEAQAALADCEGLLLTQHASEALPLLERAVQLGSEVYDRERSPALAGAQIALSDCLLALGQRDRAKEMLGRARAIHSTYKELGPHRTKPLHDLESRLSASAPRIRDYK